MNFNKSLVVKEAVMGSIAVFRERRLPVQLNPRQFKVLATSLGVAGVIVLGLFFISGQGDLTVLRQRLVGQVHLSTGVYSARTVTQLNHLSWQNGLDILTALETVNGNLRQLEKLQSKPRTKKAHILAARRSLNESVKKLDVLLADRQILEDAAKILKANTLYTPVYQEFLKDTMARVADASPRKNTSENLVQDTTLPPLTQQ